MVNKKGLLRVVESTIAVIILLVVLILVSADKNIEVEPDIVEFLNPILEELAENNSFRERVFNAEFQALEDVKSLLFRKIQNPSYNYDVRICSDINDICSLTVFCKHSRKSPSIIPPVLFRPSMFTATESTRS